MRRSSPWPRCISASFVVGAVVALMLTGAGCSSDESVPCCGEQILVRTASGGVMDVAGTVWTGCYPDEPSPGMSRRTTEIFGDGTFTFAGAVFTASLDCTGAADPALTHTATAQLAAQGDRTVGWNGAPPPDLATTVTASAALLTGFTPGLGYPDPMKTLFFVNDLASPQTVHMGKGAVASDGYPITLEPWGKERVAP